MVPNSAKKAPAKPCSKLELSKIRHSKIRHQGIMQVVRCEWECVDVHPVPPSSNKASAGAMPRRFRFQFGLRLLLLLVTLASALMAWVVQRRQAVVRERAAMAQLERFGAQIQYSTPTDTPDEYLLVEDPPGPDWARSILGDGFFSPLVCVEFPPIPYPVYTPVDKGFYVTSKRWLEYRDLFGDEHLGIFQNVGRVDLLDLRRTKISPSGIDQIRRMFPDCQIEAEPRLVQVGRFLDDEPSEGTKAQRCDTP